MNHMTTEEVLLRKCGWQPDGELDQEVAARRDAWIAERTDDLHSDPAKLVEAIDDWTKGQSPGALKRLLVALTAIDKKDATTLDRIVHQHDDAMDVIDELVKECVAAEANRKDFLP